VKEYDLGAQAQLLKGEKERKEKLFQDVITELRKKCKAENCSCIAEEANATGRIHIANYSSGKISSTFPSTQEHTALKRAH
jgi:hypothetical protein